ncbi:hypothetical protein OAL10_09635 [Gammaproteobacteria bacterium]|nr:hypothetical protein [Gammaproteobacteria bacterium]
MASQPQSFSYIPEQPHLEAALFLASDAAANITGQTLNVGGGMVKD